MPAAFPERQHNKCRGLEKRELEAGGDGMPDLTPLAEVQALQPQRRLGPFQHSVAIQEREHGRLH